MYFNFKNEKLAKTGKALLTLAFGLTAKESSNNKNELIISGIQMSKEALYKDVPNEKKVLLDIKGLLDRKEYENAGYSYWRL